MATATKTSSKKSKTRRPTSGKARRRGPAKASTNGAAKTQTAPTDKFAPNQKVLVDDVDERIPELDEACQKYFAATDKIVSARADKEMALDGIGKLLHEHELDCYIKNGRKFFFEPSKEEVRVKKVKQQ